MGIFASRCCVGLVLATILGVVNAWEVQVNGVVEDVVAGTIGSPVDLRFRFFAGETGGSELGPGAFRDSVPLDRDGYFSIAIDAPPFQTVFVEVAVRPANTATWDVLAPRMNLDHADRALYADRAATAITVSPGAVGRDAIASGAILPSHFRQGEVQQRGATSLCPTGQYLSGLAQSGAPICVTLPPGQKGPPGVPGGVGVSLSTMSICTATNTVTSCATACRSMTVVAANVAPCTAASDGGTCSMSPSTTVPFPRLCCVCRPTE